MNVTPLRASLHAKLLVAVIVCALVPLAAVGTWLSRSAIRSGQLLLQTQLDSAAARTAGEIQQRWQLRKSDVLMLAMSGPVRAGLEDPRADSVPAYARRAYGTMTGISTVTAKDAVNRIRWTLGEERFAELRSLRSADSSDPSPILIRVPVSDDADHLIGEVEANIRLDALAPPLPTIDVAPSQFVAYRDRSTGAQLAPGGVPAASFTNHTFEWNDHRWLAVRRGLAEPPIDVIAAAQLDPFLEPFARTARVGEAALALAAAMVIVLTIVVTSRLTRSLSTLAVAADRVSRGALDTRVHNESADEVGRVGRAFNTMLDNISRMMRELSQREAVAAMGEIAATLAHQLRSPATAIRVDVQRAHDKLPASAPERALLSRALTQVDRMDRAVGASLKLARAARTDFTSLDPHEPLDRAIADVTREYASRALNVETVGVPGEPVYVCGDAASLEQLFGNILTNAAQASSDGGYLRVLVESNGDPHVIITVQDSGAGMPPNVLARAGEPLFSTKPEGTGLGLAISKRIAAAHGGTVSIESVSGVGTTVTIKLRRASVEDHVTAARTSFPPHQPTSPR